ncbi:DUF2314 domain-containing protein [Sagittula sp. SSi028]|uniref:DUF2314 domain-containing protein n=1 Tax=Sagittula sp. SSi028 TaxID=3400636 RepID=UPI003AF779E5
MPTRLLIPSLVVAALCASPLPAQTTQNTPQLTRAIAQARASLDMVLQRLADGDGAYHPALNLKVRVEVHNFDVDHESLWVEGLYRESDGYHGRLATAPGYLPGAQLGDEIRFAADQIVDWSVLSDDGRMYGHFTTRALIAQMPAEEAGEIRDLLSATPIPDIWR